MQILLERSAENLTRVLNSINKVRCLEFKIKLKKKPQNKISVFQINRIKKALKWNSVKQT